MAQMQAHPDINTLMRSATNYVLDGVRRLLPAVQTFEDVASFLVDHPEHDSQIERLYLESGYLEVWKAEGVLNAWRYDLATMEAARTQHAEIDAYCAQTLADELQGPNRFEVNHNYYRRMADQHGLATFKLMSELYANIARQHRLRIETAAAWLRRPDATKAQFPGPLSPHSPEWFAAMTRRDPRQATMTRMVIDAAGSSDVCSICGDDPALDFRLDEPGADVVHPLTLKLCIDCVSIRASNGERFVPTTFSAP
jgi:hypothetical protein